MGGTRSYTNEQIQFVLDAWIDGKKAPEIVQAYRQTFEDQRFGVSQVKYLKSAYGEDAEFGVPLVNRVVRPPSATAGAAQSARTLAGASLSQRGFGRPSMRPILGAGANKMPTSAQQPAAFPARLASEPAPASMQGYNFGGTLSGGPSAPSLSVAGATTSSTPAAGMSAGAGPRNAPFGAARTPYGPATQGGSLGRDSIMPGVSLSGPADASWSGPGQGSSTSAQKSMAAMGASTAPISGTDGNLRDAATSSTTPGLAGLSNFPAKTAGPSASALAMRAGKAPAGDQRSFRLPTALENPQPASGSLGDWVLLSPRAAAKGEEITGWHNTSHYECPIRAKHRHDADGGIHFDGMRDLRQAMASHTCDKLEEISRAEWAALVQGNDCDQEKQEEQEQEHDEHEETARSEAPETPIAEDESTAMECDRED